LIRGLFGAIRGEALEGLTTDFSEAASDMQLLSTVTYRRDLE